MTKKNIKNKNITRKKSNKVIIIKKPINTEIEYLYPIFKNMYPDNRIKFTTTDNYDILIKSNYDKKDNKNYIFYSGESSELTDNYSFDDPNCLMKILSSKNFKDIKDTIYIPFFLNTGPFINESSPLKREYTNLERNRLAAYISRNPKEHRINFFKILKALDNTVDGLGESEKTIEKNISSRLTWWELPKVYKDYKFGFAMENKDEEGYITEKIINVYRGGAIPIYWGTSQVKNIFNIESFIYLNDYSNFEEAAKEIVKIGNDENRLRKMQNAPIFKENIEPDYSKYFNKISPKFVKEIANKLKVFKNIFNKKNIKKEKFYVINLNKRKDRWEQIQESFKNYSIDLERFPAIENEDGKIGCGLSHLAIIRMAKEKNMPYVCVMEDDSKPMEYFDNYWLLIHEWLKNNINKWYAFNGGNTIYAFHSDKESIKPICKLTDKLKLYKGKSLAANIICYNKNVYDIMLEWEKEKKGPIDHWLIDKKIDVISSTPYLAKQHNTKSNITKINSEYNWYYNHSKSMMESVNNNIYCYNGGNKHKLYMLLRGGIGNRIFQVLSAYGFAEKWNMDLHFINSSENHINMNSSKEELKVLFNNIIFDEEPKNTNIQRINEKQEFMYNEYDIPTNDAYLYGYFQSEKYFPKNKIHINLPKPANNLIKTNKNLIFIHFRLGDYLSIDNANLDLVNYYKKCINKVKENIKPTFFIFSNDIESAKKYIDTNLKSELNNYIFDNSINRLESLYYMSKCKGGICANSTFSWIGAYLIKDKNKELIFMPNPWMKYMDRNTNYDIYPEWATVMNIN